MRENEQCKAETKTLEQLLSLWKKARARHETFEKRNKFKNQHPSPNFTPKLNKTSEVLAKKNK